MRRMGRADAAEIAKFNALLRLVTEQPESVVKLAQEIPDVLEAANSTAETVLHWLAVENDVEGVKLLHGLGAQIPLFALIHAVEGGHVEMVDLPLELGARPKTYDLSKIMANPIFGLTQNKKDALTRCFERHGCLQPGQMK